MKMGQMDSGFLCFKPTQTIKYFNKQAIGVSYMASENLDSTVCKFFKQKQLTNTNWNN